MSRKVTLTRCGIIFSFCPSPTTLRKFSPQIFALSQLWERNVHNCFPLGYVLHASNDRNDLGGFFPISSSLMVNLSINQHIFI